MSLFTLILIIGFGLTIVLNMAFGFNFQTALNLFLCFAITMLPAAVFLFVGRAMPKGAFDENKKIFQVGKIRQNICSVLHVKSWKDKIPVGGRVAGFRMNRLDNPKDVSYLNRYVYESCFAEWLHTSCAVWAIAMLVFLPLVIGWNLFFTMILPISILFAWQNMVSVVIQWYMRPRIIRLRNSIKIKEIQSINKEDELATEGNI